MNNISQRDAFWNKIHDLAKNDKDIIIITADMGAPALDNIRKGIPSQFINVGIAEQNAINIAAGLSLSGKKVFTYAIAPFITLRCYEQIRIQCGMMKLPITIVGVGVGFGYQDSGPTHHLIEDLAVMRTLPNMIINTMTDSVMSSAFAEISCKMQNANYIRLSRQILPNIYTDNTDFSKGMTVLREARDYYIVSTGSMIHEALKIVDVLKDKGITVGLIDVYSLPINQNLFLNIIGNAKKLISLEEHFLPGGFGSAISEVLTDNNHNIPLKRIGLPIDKGYCYMYGGMDVIRGYYGIDTDGITEQIVNFLRKK